MLIVALVLAVIGLAALVTAVVTSNELIAWVCIGASVIGVVLLIVDALRERSKGEAVRRNPCRSRTTASRSSTRTIPKKRPSRRTTTRATRKPPRSSSTTRSQARTATADNSLCAKLTERQPSCTVGVASNSRTSSSVT